MGNTTSTTGGWSTPSEPPAKTSGEPEFVGGRWTTNEEDLTANPSAKTAWKKKLMPLIPKLVRPRLFQMPTDDWKDPRDVEYAARNSGAILAQFGAIA